MTLAAELTSNRLKARMARYVGWTKPADWPSECDAVEIQNEAGDWLTSIEEWNWLARPIAPLDLVSGQSFLTLPDDFARHVFLRGALNSGWLITIEDLERVALQQSMVAQSASRYVGAYVGSPTAPNGPRSGWRIELGPIPDASATGAFLLAYEAGWAPITKGDDHIVVPIWMQPLYARIACEWLAGWEQPKKGTLEDRLDRIVGSNLFKAAKDRDDTVQVDLGPVRNTAVDTIAGGENGETIYMNRSNISIVSG